jgi:hypothetical protein
LNLNITFCRPKGNRTIIVKNNHCRGYHNEKYLKQDDTEILSVPQFHGAMIDYFCNEFQY